MRSDSDRLWSIDHDQSLIRARPLDAQSLALQIGETTPRVQVIDPHTGKNRGAGWARAILADSPAGQPAVILELDATKRLKSIEIPSRRPARVPVEPPCPEINASWFASGGAVLGLGHSRIAHVTADGRCRVSELGNTALNFWWAGIDSTGLVYVASSPDEELYTIRPEDAELRLQPGVAANEVLAVPSLPGAVVANRTSIALFSGTREVWRTREAQWAGPRAMARSQDFVGVRYDQAEARGIAILKASDGGLLERARLQAGGAFAFVRRCLLWQDMGGGQSDWVTFRALGTGTVGKLAQAHLSISEGNPGRVARDIAFVQDLVLVSSGGQLDAYRMPGACR
jgi:hypothetical protein